jgi:hypothetical protein
MVPNMVNRYRSETGKYIYFVNPVWTSLLGSNDTNFNMSRLTTAMANIMATILSILDHDPQTNNTNCDISVNRAIGFVSISAVLVIPFGTLVNINDLLNAAVPNIPK